MLRNRLAVALSLLLGAATAGAAQVSLGVAGAYVSLGGDDFAILKPGVGPEVNLMLGLGQSLQLGASAQYSWHGVEGADGTQGVLGVLGEARYLIGTGRAKVYLAGRAGFARAMSNDFDVSFPPDGNPDEVSASGTVFGGGAGVVIALSPSLALDLAALFHAVSFGDASVNGNTVPGTELSGTALQIRGGFRFGRR